MFIAQLLKKQIWILYVVFTVASAYLSANIINLNLAARIDTTPKIDLAPRTNTTTADPAIEDYDVVLQRNIFNSKAVLMESLKGLAEAAGISVLAADMDLIGTMAGPPSLSLALIAKRSGDGSVEIYRWGDKIGDYLVTSIERKQVRLMKDNKEEILKMPEDRKVFAFNKPVKEEKLMEGIKKTGEDSRVVDRSVIEDSFENFGKLMRQARVVPNIKDGKIDGFKVYRIKKDSLFSQIGLENGDVIKQVNGSEISGPEDALKLFEVFKTAKSITINLERKGAKKSLAYTVR